MPAPTDDEFDRMTPAEKAEHARRRAGAKYSNPHLDRTGDGSGRGGLIFWAAAVFGLIALGVAVAFSLQGQFANLNDRGDPHQHQIQSPAGLPPPNLQPALNGPKPRQR